MTHWLGDSIFIWNILFLLHSHCIQFIYNFFLKEASFQQFPLLPKQMSDISGFPSSAHEASRRITLLVFLTNVRHIKNSTPQTGVTQIHVELLENLNRVLYKSHTTSDWRLTMFQGWHFFAAKNRCVCVCWQVCVEVVVWLGLIYVSGTLLVCKSVFFSACPCVPALVCAVQVSCYVTVGVWSVNLCRCIIECMCHRC